MIAIACPWCTAAVELENVDELRCPECAVVVEIAADRQPIAQAAA